MKTDPDQANPRTNAMEPQQFILLEDRGLPDTAKLDTDNTKATYPELFEDTSNPACDVSGRNIAASKRVKEDANIAASR